MWLFNRGSRRLSSPGLRSGDATSGSGYGALSTRREGLTVRASWAHALRVDQLTGQGQIVTFQNLPATKHAVEFVGADHGEVPFSIIIVRSPAGAGPRLHRHPYAEVFVVEAGRATFRLGETRIVVPAGHVVVAPSNVAHGFENSGRGELRLIAIHGAGQFDTEWLEEVDREWASRRGALDRRRSSGGDHADRC